MKKLLLKPKEVLDCITELLIVNPVFTGFDLTVNVIANEYAGSFTQKKKSAYQRTKLMDAVQRAHEKKSVVKSVKKNLLMTEYSGHAEIIARRVVEQIAALKKRKPTDLFVVATAGGDGTSVQVQTGLIKIAQESEEYKKIVMDELVVIRLPMGTGCDGTDGHTIEEAIEILENPVHFANARAVKVWYEGTPKKENYLAIKKNPSDYGNISITPPWYAFNMAGMGLDGFVCHASNVMKSKLPGDSYSLWVNLAALLYDRAFPSGFLHAKVYDENDNLINEIDQQFEMLVLGSSGNRIFGGGKNILPQDENLCIIDKLTPLTLILRNNEVNDGRFVRTKLGKVYHARKVVFDYDKAAVIQLDGETHLLVKECFPLTMQVTEPYIQILESDSQTCDKGAVRKDKISK